MQFETPQGPVEAEIHTLVVAGWTGRDSAAVQHHIDELAEIGVAPPSQVPLFYRTSASLLTQAPDIQVLGDDTSGEVEPLVIRSAGQLWLGLGSDHTDRALETVSVAASKQICPKPVASTLWPFDGVKARLDRLVLRCEIDAPDGWTVYQDGTLASIRPLAELIGGAALPEGGAMLCGTLAAIGGVRPADRYRMTLEDPDTDRRMSLEYSVICLPGVA